MWKVLTLLALLTITNGVYVPHPEKHCKTSDMLKMVKIFKNDVRAACKNGHQGNQKITNQICTCFSDDGVKVKKALGKIPDCHIGFAGEDVHLEDLFNINKCKVIVAKQKPGYFKPKKKASKKKASKKKASNKNGSKKKASKAPKILPPVPKKPKLFVMNPEASEREQVMLPHGFEFPAELQEKINAFKDVATGAELQSFWDIVKKLTCDCIGCVWFWGAQGWRPCDCIDGLADVVKKMIEFVNGILEKAINWVFDNIGFLRNLKNKIQSFIEEKFGKPIKDCQKETGFSLGAITKRFKEMCAKGKIDFGKVFAGADKFFACMKRKAFGAAELARLEEEMKTILVLEERLAEAEAQLANQRRLAHNDKCGVKRSHCQSGGSSFFQDPTLVFTLGFTMSGAKATINLKFGLQTGRLAVTFGLVNGLSGKTYENAYKLIMEKLGKELPSFSGFEVQFFRKFSFNKQGIPMPMINIPLGDMLPAPVGPFIKLIIKGGIVRLSLLRVKSCEDNHVNLGGGCRLTFGGLAITPMIPLLSGASPPGPPPTLIMPIWSTTIVEFYTGLITKNGKQCGYGIGGLLCGGAKTTPYNSLTAYATEAEADAGMLADIQTYKAQVSRARAVEDFFISQVEQETVDPTDNSSESNLLVYGAAGAVIVAIGGLLVRRIHAQSDYKLLLEA